MTIDARCRDHRPNRHGECANCLLNAVLDSGLPRRLQLLAITLATYMGEASDDAEPSLERLAQNCDVTVHTMQRKLRELMDLGVAVPFHHTCGRPTIYRLNVSALPTRDQLEAV